MAKSNSITLWEKSKRVVANLFDVETKSQIEERIRKQAEEEIQERLRLQHAQHIRSLMVEHADQIEEWNKERQRMKQEAEDLEIQRALFEKEMEEREKRRKEYWEHEEMKRKYLYNQQQEDTVEEDSIDDIN